MTVGGYNWSDTNGRHYHHHQQQSPLKHNFSAAGTAQESSLYPLQGTSSSFHYFPRSPLIQKSHSIGVASNTPQSIGSIPETNQWINQHQNFLSNPDNNSNFKAIRQNNSNIICNDGSPQCCSRNLKHFQQSIGNLVS